MKKMLTMLRFCPPRCCPSAPAPLLAEGRCPPRRRTGEMGSSVSFTDSLGSTITLEEAPQRVAALIGSYAETWVLAGGEDTLAAVTQDAYG